MIIQLIIAALLGGALGTGITYIICRYLPQEKIRELNEQVLQEETETLNALKYNKDCINKDIEVLKKEKQTVKESLTELQEQAIQSANIFYEQQMSLIQERLDHSLQEACAKYQADEEAYQKEYLQIIEEYATTFANTIKVNQNKCVELKAQLEDLQNKVNVAVAAAKREEEKRNEKDFYRLVLSDTDLVEIQYLRQVEPFLRDKEALNKVIWKVYYEKPYTDLIGRVVGSSVKTGIYKITNMNNQMCYVGQAVNIADRWRQHIKRGVGAEAPTRNKLYPAMLSLGVHNFTFEIIEECDRSLLNEREDYWQDYFKAKEFGYSIK